MSSYMVYISICSIHLKILCTCHCCVGVCLHQLGQVVHSDVIYMLNDFVCLLVLIMKKEILKSSTVTEDLFTSSFNSILLQMFEALMLPYYIFLV